MNIKKQKCGECGSEVQSYNMENHSKNHELERKALGRHEKVR